MYKAKLQQEVIEVRDKHIIFDNIDDAIQVACSNNDNQFVNRYAYSPDDIDIGEDVFRVLSSVQSYWSQFGFMDKCNLDVQKIVQNIMKHVSIEPVEEDMQDDSDAPICEDPDDLLISK